MDDVLKQVIVLIFISFICNAYSDCILSLNKDFGNPGPVFIRHGKFLEPNVKGGNITLRRSEILLVSCPGTKRRVVLGNDTTSYDTMEAHCIVNSTFRVDRRILQFKEIRCNTQPFFSSVETKGVCVGNNQVHEVGYKVRSTFYPLYSACFDQQLLHTHYVTHQLTPMSVYMQTGLKRPAFVEGTLFGKVRMSAAYKTSNQRTRLDAILGRNMSDKYLSKHQFLTRGHMAANADFATSAETRATFHYVNTAPQWMKGNAGDWAALEEALRRRVQARNTDVTVYTGTHGIMQLPDSRGHLKDIFLFVDENNNPLVPVPMYYYKVVYDPKKKTAAAFVTINSSFYNSSMTNDLQFCDDICKDNPKYSWLKWRSNDGTHSFCCDYDQFTETIDYLPKIDVEGQFY